MQLQRENVITWIAKWGNRRDGNLRDCWREVEHNVAMRDRTERGWTYMFIAMCIVPCLVLMLLFYSMMAAPEDTQFNLLEFGYALYFASQFYIVIDATCLLSRDSKKYRVAMLTSIAKGDATFCGTDPFQQIAFTQLVGIFKGFRILGFEVSQNFRFRLIQVSSAFSIPIVYKAAVSMMKVYCPSDV